MRRVFFSFGFIIILLFGVLPSSEAVIDRVVAIINQEIITLSEVEKWSGPLEAENQVEDRLERKGRAQELRRKVLERLIEEKLIDQEVKRTGVKVTNKEVEAMVEDIKAQNSITQEQLEMVLIKDGLTLEAYKKQIEKRLQSMKLVTWNVKVEAKPGEKELRDFYQENIDLYRNNETFRPAHILFTCPKEAGPDQVREIKKKCQKVLEKVKEGEDFGEMAILYSEDLSSKDRGDLGDFKKGELLPAFEKEALRLQVGEVSQIVRTEFGFHIIKLLDHKEGQPIPFEDVKEKVRTDFYEREREKAFKHFVSTLKEKAVIEIKL